MIILLSVLFLLALVYYGIKRKEGMTIPDGMELTKQLGIYYDQLEKNKTGNIDNSKNDKEAYQQIENLNLTDDKYMKIMNNPDLNESSKLHSINTLLTNSITGNGKYDMTAEQYQNILKTLNGTSLSDSEKVIDIANKTYKDPRFKSLQDATYKNDTDKLDFIQKTVLSILNNPPSQK